jgi:3-methylcrotonyl-CoA carboxylase alpha subunit
MDAVVIALEVAAGQMVARNAPLLVLEAMKMEVVIRAPHDGVVEAVFVASGQTVKSGGKLAAVVATQATKS